MSIYTSFVILTGIIATSAVVGAIFDVDAFAVAAASSLATIRKFTDFIYFAVAVIVLIVADFGQTKAAALVIISGGVFVGGLMEWFFELDLWIARRGKKIDKKQAAHPFGETVISGCF